MTLSAGAEDVQSADEVPPDLAAAAREFDPNTRNTDGRLWARTAELRRRFGAGIHQCLGRNVARLEIKVAIEEIFTRLPGLRLTAEEVVFGQGQNWGPTALRVAWERA